MALCIGVEGGSGSAWCRIELSDELWEKLRGGHLHICVGRCGGDWYAIVEGLGVYKCSSRGFLGFEIIVGEGGGGNVCGRNMLLSLRGRWRYTGVEELFEADGVRMACPFVLKVGSGSVRVLGFPGTLSLAESRSGVWRVWEFAMIGTGARYRLCIGPCLPSAAFWERG